MAPPTRPTAGSLLPVLREPESGLRQRRSLLQQEADFAGFSPNDLLTVNALRGRSTDLAEKIFDLAEDFALFADSDQKEFAKKARKDLTSQSTQYGKTVKNFVDFAKQKLSAQAIKDNSDLIKAVEQSGRLYPAAIELYVTAFRKFLKNPRRGGKVFLVAREEITGIKNALLTNLRALGRLVARSK